MDTAPGALRALAVLALLGPAAAEPLPSFRATGMALDTLTPGDTAQVAFAFTNTTADTILLDEAAGECGCGVRTEPGRRYAPGDSGTVLVTVNTASERPSGSREIALTFRAAADTTREQTATVVLTITAPVRPAVRFVPDVLAGMLAGPGRPSAVAGAFANQTDRPVRVESLALDTPTVLDMLTRQLPCVLGPHEQMPFAVCVRPQALAEGVTAVRSRVRARTQGTKYAEHVCDVYLYLE